MIPSNTSHLLMVFNEPGPMDANAEMEEILSALTQMLGIPSLPKSCKRKAVVKQLQGVTDYEMLVSMMQDWLQTEAQSGTGFNIGRVGYRQSARPYDSFQIAWATPLSTMSALQEKPPQKKRWQFWK